jgi:hypothetical protein
MPQMARREDLAASRSRTESRVLVPAEAAEYAQAVGNRVTELIEQALEGDPHAARTDPNCIAEVIADLIVDKVAGPARCDFADLVAPLWTAEHARRVLKLSRATMAERRKTGSLLALRTTGGDFFYPVSQFEKRNGKVQVKPALRKFMMALRDQDPWTTAVLMQTPASELRDQTPLGWIRDGGDPQTLASYAEVLRAEIER